MLYVCACACACVCVCRVPIFPPCLKGRRLTNRYHACPVFVFICTRRFHIATCTEPPEFPKNLHPEGHKFLEKCFSIEPGQRPTVAMLLYHPYMRVDYVDMHGQFCPPPASAEDDMPSPDPSPVNATASTRSPFWEGPGGGGGGGGGQMSGGSSSSSSDSSSSSSGGGGSGGGGSKHRNSFERGGPSSVASAQAQAARAASRGIKAAVQGGAALPKRPLPAAASGAAPGAVKPNPADFVAGAVNNRRQQSQQRPRPTASAPRNPKQGRPAGANSGASAAAAAAAASTGGGGGGGAAAAAAAAAGAARGSGQGARQRSGSGGNKKPAAAPAPAQRAPPVITAPNDTPVADASNGQGGVASDDDEGDDYGIDMS